MIWASVLPAAFWEATQLSMPSLTSAQVLLHTLPAQGKPLLRP